MPVSYSTIKAVSEPDAIGALLMERVIGPVLPSVTLKKVKTRIGRRFEAPRILWNVYEAELELPGGIEAKPLFWTKAYFDDTDCQAFRTRLDGLLSAQNGNPLDPTGYARFFPELNMFLFMFPTDPAFPALPKVSQSDAVRPIVIDHFDRLAAGKPVGSLDAVRVKYLPEISCILRFEATLGDDDPEPKAIYGKVQPSHRGRLTYDVMKAIWELPARVAGELVVSEPLAYYPRYNLLLQSAVPGEEIKGDRHADVFRAQCEAAGRTIGYIHGSGISVGDPHTVDVEVGRLARRLEDFKMSSPNVYLMLRDLLKHVDSAAERILPESPVPSHGDYKYNQFLFDGSKFGLIDVEYFVQAEPSFDLGKFCGHLVPSLPKHWSDTAAAEEARRIFLDAYLAVRPNYRGQRFPIYEALSLATRALVVTWAQSRNWEYTAQTLLSMAFERLKTRWGE